MNCLDKTQNLFIDYINKNGVLVMTTKTWWSMEDLMNESNESRKWIKDNLFKNEDVWKEIESFSYLPKHNNDEYRFIGTKMRSYLENNFKRLKEG